MQIEKIEINKVKPYENNAKLHPPEQIKQLKKSIKEFGNNDPIAIDENNVIIEGHGRYFALKELGFKDIETIRIKHLTQQQKKAYALIHNKLTMNTGFDIDILEAELNDILELDMSDFDFSTQSDNTNESFIEDLMQEELGKREIASDYYSLTLIFPIENKEKVENYIKSNGRQSLVSLCLKEMESK